MSNTTLFLSQLGDPATLTAERMWSLASSLQQMRGKMGYNDAEVEAKLLQIYGALETLSKANVVSPL